MADTSQQIVGYLLRGGVQRREFVVDLSKGDQAGAIAAVENVLARLKG